MPHLQGIRSLVSSSVHPGIGQDAPSSPRSRVLVISLHWVGWGWSHFFWSVIGSIWAMLSPSLQVYWLFLNKGRRDGKLLDALRGVVKQPVKIGQAAIFTLLRLYPTKMRRPCHRSSLLLDGSTALLYNTLPLPCVFPAHPIWSRWQESAKTHSHLIILSPNYVVYRTTCMP